MINTQDHYNNGGGGGKLTSADAPAQTTYRRFGVNHRNTKSVYHSSLTSGTTMSRAAQSNNWRSKRTLAASRRIDENDVGEVFADNNNIDSSHEPANREQMVNRWLNQNSPSDIFCKQEQQQASSNSFNNSSIFCNQTNNHSKVFMNTGDLDNWPSNISIKSNLNANVTPGSSLAQHRPLTTLPPPGSFSMQSSLMTTSSTAAAASFEDLLFEQRSELQQQSPFRKKIASSHDNNPFMGYTGSSFYPNQFYNQYPYQQSYVNGLLGTSNTTLTTIESGSVVDHNFPLYHQDVAVKQESTNTSSNNNISPAGLLNAYTEHRHYQQPLVDISNNYISGPAVASGFRQQMQEDIVDSSTMNGGVKSSHQHAVYKNRPTWSNIVAGSSNSNNNNGSSALLTPQQNHLQHLHVDESSSSISHLNTSTKRLNNNNAARHLHIDDNATVVTATANPCNNPSLNFSTMSSTDPEQPFSLHSTTGFPVITTAPSNKTPRYISDSIYFLASKFYNSFQDSMIDDKMIGILKKRTVENKTLVSITNRAYTVIKVTNLPWSIHSSDIKTALERNSFIRIPPGNNLPQNVHILMDVKTGKTTGTAYAEVVIPDYLGLSVDIVLNSIAFQPVQGRRIKFIASSYGELCQELLPAWSNGFLPNGLAIIQPHNIAAMDDVAGGGSNGSLFQYSNSNKSNGIQCNDDATTVTGTAVTADRGSEMTLSVPTSDMTPFFIEQKDLQNLLNICRHYKNCYNRKCAERPFEYLISITLNMPWKQPRSVTTIQRDIIYECFKLVTVALHEHTTRNLHSFDKDLLPRMVRTALLCDGFTAKQKSGILTSSHLACPKDLQKYLQEPPILNDFELINMIR